MEYTHGTLHKSRSVTGEVIRAPKSARPAARRDQHAQHRQPPQQPPGGYPQRRWTPARPRSPIPRRRLGCRSGWRDPASRCLVARPPATSGGCRAGLSSVRRSRLRATSLETESSVASIFAKYPRYLGVLTPITMHLLSNELNNEGLAHCKSSLFNNEGTWAHCWNNEQGSLCHKSQ